MLTMTPEKFYRFCMSGTIRTKEHCRKCGNKYQGKPLTCPTCLTTPHRYFIDLPWRGEKIRLYSDQRGFALASWDHAYHVLSHIRTEIDNQTFDPRNYVKRDLKQLQFATYFKTWLERRQMEQDRGRLSRSYIRSCETWFKRLEPFFKDRNIRDINEGNIEDFINSLPPDLAPKTINNILGILHKMLADALRRRDIQRLPNFPRIEPGEQPIKWITREQQEQILEYVRCPVHKALFTFLMFTGCRPGEARALRWEDINWKQKTVTIHAAMDQENYRPSTKEKDVRILPLHPATISVLKDLPRSISGFVFMTMKSVPFTGNQIYKTWMRAAKKAGIEINLYQGTKHSLGCQLLNSGVREEILQALFGHRDRKSTKRYAKMVSDSLKYWEE